MSKEECLEGAKGMIFIASCNNWHYVCMLCGPAHISSTHCHGSHKACLQLELHMKEFHPDGEPKLVDNEHIKI